MNFLLLALIAPVILLCGTVLYTQQSGKESNPMQQEPMPPKAAVILGSTGAVGQRLLDELVRSPNFSTILTVVRKPTNNLHGSDKVVEHVVSDSAKLESEVEAAINAKVKEKQCVGFSTLGIGHGTAFMTIDQHRAVDVDMNANFAKALKNSGRVNHFVLMTSAASNPKAWDWGPGGAGFPRYLRVKGEAEEAVKNSGIDHVSIFRPGAILGIPNTPKLAEMIVPLFSFMTPANYLSVKVDDLARSMALRGQMDVSSEKEKSTLYHYPEMMELLAQVIGPH